MLSSPAFAALSSTCGQSLFSMASTGQEDRALSASAASASVVGFAKASARPSSVIRKTAGQREGHSPQPIQFSFTR